MKIKSALALAVLFVVLFVAWRSYPLQDGYTLGGFKGHNGWLFGKSIMPLVSEEVMGIQGCKKGYLFGWVKTGKNFVVNTHKNEVIWLSPQEQFVFIETIGCPPNNMNNDINLAGFNMGGSFISL